MIDFAIPEDIQQGRSTLAAWAMNCMGPQDATMLTLLDHGTQEQKERFLVPLVNGERRICFSMTERAAGSDATGMRTTAVRDGQDWILNGEKWFSSSASISDYALVMARTDADAPRHRQFTTFLVELPDPGYQIVRDIPTLHEAGRPGARPAEPGAPRDRLPRHPRAVAGRHLLRARQWVMP